MPLRRRYRDGRVVSTPWDLYQDRLHRWSDIQEYMPFLHEMALKHPRILELGTRSGNSTIAFLAAVEKNGGHLTSVDISPQPMGPHPQWTFIQGDDMSQEVWDKLPFSSKLVFDGFDLVFIDTSHYYEHTLQECRRFIPLIYPGGIALFHDTRLFMHPHEYEWHEDVPPVRKALDDYCAETGRTWEELPGEYGLGIIQIA